MKKRALIFRGGWDGHEPMLVSERFEDGQALVELAREKGLGLGGAPDTFMGAGIQTCRRLIEDGYIGEVVGARASMLCRGHESWHPNPSFYYERGGGPLFDMGPYYLTALINLLGGIRSVTARGRRAFEERLITSQPQAGTRVPVEVDTDIHAILEFDSGVLATLSTSFDTVWDQQAAFYVFGSEGTLAVPDPNTFGGPVRLLRHGQREWHELPLLYGYETNSRGLGLADMAAALAEGRDWRANGEQLLHVLDAMCSIQASADNVETVTLRTEYTPGAPMLRGALDGVVEG